MDRMKKKKRKLIFFGLLLIIIIAIICLYYFNKRKTITDINEEEQHSVETIDADEYYDENSTVMETIKASTSDTMHTESEAIDNLKNRGFKEDVYCDYTQEGEFIDETIVPSSGGTAKHPMYYTFYITNDNKYWLVYLINDKYFANPLSYNQNSDRLLYLSESESITSYDNVSDTFYDTVPNENVLEVLQVEKIDAETLNNVNLEEK